MVSLAAMVLAAGVGSLTAAAQATPALRLEKTIPLPGVTGKFDHFAIDLETNRLFAAATGNHSVEVIDLKTGKVVQSIAGLGKPHGLAWVAGSLFVSDGTLAELRVYKGTPLALAGNIKLSDDADDMVYNSAAHLLYVGHGGSDAANPAKVAVVDTERFVLVANLDVATHPEALDIDPESGRVFANIADSSEVALVATATNSIAGNWKLKEASDNVPMAYDAQHKTLYIACRKPAVVIALDAVTGAEISRLPASTGADDLFYDPELQRVYVITGAGEVDAYQVDAKRTLRALEVLHTAPGAKTALFVPSQSLLYVGIPGGASGG